MLNISESYEIDIDYVQKALKQHVDYYSIDHPLHLKLYGKIFHNEKDRTSNNFSIGRWLFLFSNDPYENSSTFSFLLKVDISKYYEITDDEVKKLITTVEKTLTKLVPKSKITPGSGSNIGLAIDEYPVKTKQTLDKAIAVVKETSMNIKRFDNKKVNIHRKSKKL